ncbi:MAG: T9SS type A sorting domain-containing protein [Bacteroidota bacterium]
MNYKKIQAKVLVAALVLVVSLVGTKPSIAQTKTGTVGYESKHVTVSFSDMVVYDAAHPELKTNNIKPREVEFNHQDIIEKKHANDAKHSPPSSKSIHHQPMIPLAASPAPITTFQGETDNGSTIPPDVSGAVGPNHIMTTHNQDVKISSKTGTQISSVTLTAFWSAIGATMASDPKVLYDPFNDRFIFTTLVNYLTTSPLLAIGVTQTNDPTGTWNLFSVNVDNTGTNFLDYPEIGFNKNWVAIGGNMFNQTSQTFAGLALYVFNKANLYGNVNAQHSVFIGSTYFDTTDFCLTPASTFDNNLNNLFCLESYDGVLGEFRQFTISGTPSAPVLSTPLMITSSNHWDAGTPADFGIQSGSTTRIDLDDDRISGSIVYRNGNLWVAHNAFLPQGNVTRCSSHWMELDTLGNIQQDGLIDDPTNQNFFVYSAVAVASNSNAIIGFTHLGNAIHPTSAYSFRAATDPINYFRNAYDYKLGLSVDAAAPGQNRWGDYSFACIDPVDDSTFWTITEYAANPANTWGTWWAKINPTCITPYTPLDIIGPTSICSTNTSGVYYSVAAVAGATSYTWTVSGTGWTSVSSTTDSILITPGTGTGTITCTANNACGSNTAQTLTVYIVNGIPTPSTINGPASVCNGTSVNYSILPDSSYSSYTWSVPSGWTGSSSTNSLTTLVGSTNGNITVIVTNGCGSSLPDTIYVSLPVAPTANSPFTINCGDSITLTASGNATITWFDQSTGGNLLDTGSTYITPPLAHTTTFYAENDNYSPHEYCPPFDSAMGGGSIFNNATSRYLIFNCTYPCTLVSVLVYATNAGNRTITMWDGAGNVLDSVTVNIPVGASRVTLNFPIVVGNNYELGVTGVANLYRNSTGTNYPYNDPNGYISITGSNAASRYYYFYDWELAGQGCGSARVPVVVNVTNGVTAAFTYTQNGTTLTFTNTSTGATSWLWNFGDGSPNSNLQNPVHTFPTLSGYNVTLYAYNGTCTDSITFYIDLNTSINSIDAIGSLKIIPNPTTGVFNLDTKFNATEEVQLTITNAIGQKVYETLSISTTGKVFSIDLHKESKGIYFVQMKTKKGNITRKLILE